MAKEPFIELTPEDFEDLYFETALSKELDRFLAYARDHHGVAPFMPVVGLTGSGKTSIIRSWLKHTQLKSWYIEGYRQAKAVEVEDFPPLPAEPGIRLISGEELAKWLTPRKKTIDALFTPEELDAVDPQTVIVIDDYDRFGEKERKALFDLIAHKRAIDVRSEKADKTKVLNPLMIIAVLDAGNCRILNEEEKRLFGLAEE